MEHENSPQVEILTLDTIARKRSIPPSLFGIAILLFFFNFCEMSCQGQRLAAISGIQLATGTTIEPPKMSTPFGTDQQSEENSKKLPGNIWAILALLAAVTGLGIYLIGNNYENLVGTVAGGAGALSLLLLQSSITSSIGAEGGGIIVISFLFAYWASLLTLAAGGAISAYRFYQKIGRMPSRAVPIPFDPQAAVFPPFVAVPAPPETVYQPKPDKPFSGEAAFQTELAQAPPFYIPPPVEVPIVETEQQDSTHLPPPPAKTTAPESTPQPSPLAEKPPVAAEPPLSATTTPPFVVQNAAQSSVSQHFNLPKEPYFGAPQPATGRSNGQSWIIWLIAAAVLLIIAVTIVMESGLLSDTPTSSKVEKGQSKRVGDAAGTKPLETDTGTTSNADVTIGYIKTKHGSDVRLRATPAETGDIMMNIPNGSPVIILGYDDHTSTVDGQIGKWCKVKHSGKIGWVWDRFIVKKQGE